ncbi:chloramphenicol phosphotransferase CPT [Nonomuraea rubra]|uniref:Chloramphenicol 3-O phosphotransferase n=1 Tax=Nonomuraea rubra TaxID=46180 RepID=A0A7X0U4M0_9ACTN|nr:chloramphenicol phosphotransferase CPT [Nonomuraea rubra]MBB6554610.1 chloramphenicol 3-O phosphotransferase [Nonomuraea rubra]
MTQVIVLNGGSSAGKSALARSLQAVLPEPWLSISIDDLVDAMPAAMQTSDAGIEITSDGEVNVGPDFRRLQHAWREGVATMARAGAPVIIDDVFLGGPSSQQEWEKALAGLDVLWVGVRCDAAVAARRELARRDRPPGMAELQAEVAHQGVRYDVEVDTTDKEPLEAARVVAAHVR